MITTSRPERPSRWPLVVQILVCPLILAVTFGLSGLIGLVPALAVVEEPGTPIAVAVGVLVGIHLLILIVALAAVMLVARLDGQRRLRDLGVRWDRRSLPGLLLGLGISAAVLAGIGIPLTTAGQLRPLDAGTAGVPGWATLIVGLSLGFVLQGIPEELIFRGYLLRSVRLRPASAVLVSGFAFGVLHLISNGGQQDWAERIMYLAMPTGFGLAAGALVLLTRSWWAAVGIHGGFHLTCLLATLAGPGDGTSRIGAGPALWLLSGAAYTLVAVVALVLLRVRAETGSEAAAEQAQVAG